MKLHSLTRQISLSAFRLELALAVAVLAVFVFELCAARQEQSALASEVLRLHVIANSNSPEDQALKYAVRDRILAEYSKELESFSKVSEAEAFVLSERENIELLALDALQGEDCDLSVSASLEDGYFPQKKYGNTVFPAGEYRALRVVIGKGAGENWWCVMFPPMCCFAQEDSSELLGEEWEITTDDGVEVKFRLRILEIWGRLRQNRKQSDD